MRPYDNAESDLLKDFERRFLSTVSELRSRSHGSFSGLDPERSWKNRIASTPKYAYQERLCVGAPDANVDLVEDYARLAAYLADHILQRADAERVEQLKDCSEALAKIASRLVHGEEHLAQRLDQAVLRQPETTKRALPSLLLRFVSVANPDDADSVVLVRQNTQDFRPDERQILEQLERDGVVAFVGTDTPRKGPSSRRQGIGTLHVRMANPQVLSQWPQFREWVEAGREFLDWRGKLDDYARAIERYGLVANVLPSEEFIGCFDKEFETMFPHGLSVPQRDLIARIVEYREADSRAKHNLRGKKEPTCAPTRRRRWLRRRVPAHTAQSPTALRSGTPQHVARPCRGS